MDKKSRSIVPMEAEKVDHVAADVEAAEDSVAVASAVEVAVDSAEAVEAASVVTVVVDSAVTVVVDSAVAVEADSVVAVEVAAAAEVVGVTTAIKMDILLANVLRAAKTTLEAEIVTKQLIPLSQISKMKSTHMTFGLHLHRFCLLCVLQEN